MPPDITHRLATVSTYTVQQLTFNDANDRNPVISDGSIAWESPGSVHLIDAGKPAVQFSTATYFLDARPRLSGNKIAWNRTYSTLVTLPSFDPFPPIVSVSYFDIRYFNGVETLTLRSIPPSHAYYDALDSNAEISEAGVTWETTDWEDSEIVFFNGRESIRLTDNDFDDRDPSISGSNIAWEGDGEIFFYDGTAVRQLTNNNVLDRHPRISGNRVVWERNGEIFLFDGSTSRRLTNNSYPDKDPQISGQNVVWEGDGEIYFYDGSRTTRLTNNSFVDSRPRISGSNVVWQGDGEIYSFNGTDVIRITTNSVIDRNPEISGDLIVWQGFDGNDDEIFLASPGTFQLPTINVKVSSSSLREDAKANFLCTFTRSGSIAEPLTVYFTVSGSAGFDVDYRVRRAATFTAASGSVTFASGSASATLLIDPTADRVLEQDETISVTLVTVPGYIVGPSSNVTCTIIDDDTPAISVQDGVKQGLLDANDGLNPTRDNCYRTDYILTNIVPGRPVTVSLSADFDAYLQIIDSATQAVLHEDDDSGGQRNSLLTFLPEPGVSYLARATSYETAASGRYRLFAGAHPVITNSTVQGRDLILQFSEAINITGLLPERFSAQVGALISPIREIRPGSEPTTLILTLPAPAPAANTPVRLRYSDLSESNDATGVVQDLAGLDMGSLDAPGLPVASFSSGVDVGALANTYTALLLTGTAILATGNGSANHMRVSQPTAVANVFIGGAGNDSMDGGDGADIYLIADSSHHSTAEISDSGSSGSDELRFASRISGDTLTVFAADTGIERVTIGTGIATDAVTRATTALNVNASAASAALTLVGNAGSNNLQGSAFNDVLRGQRGNDILTGAAGADIFCFETSLDASANVDQITDFQPIEGDRIQLENRIFSRLNRLGSLKASAFSIGTMATRPAHRILYDNATGTLSYDSDGSGIAGATVFARLSAGLAGVLTAECFTVT